MKQPGPSPKSAGITQCPLTACAGSGVAERRALVASRSLHSAAVRGSVHATPAAAHVTRWNNCSAGFPFCLAGSLGLPSVEYTEYYARSVDLFAERAGPLSLLPASENQKTVIKWNTSEGAVQ